MKSLPTTPPEDFVITQADINHCLGSDELKRCPHCGTRAFSIGTVNRDSGNTVYHVNCENTQCMAQAFYCTKDPEEARTKAIARWNRRVE